VAAVERRRLQADAHRFTEQRRLPDVAPLNQRCTNDFSRAVARQFVLRPLAQPLRCEYRLAVALSTLELTIVYEEGEDGLVVASIPDIAGTHSQGRTREEAKANVLDALQVMLTPDEELTGADRESVRLTFER
jgi:predicted RNase H-like HicB family nuclease